jgi:thioredoxin 1
MSKKIIKFYADWCTPCKVIKPIFNELEKQYTDIIFESCNIETNQELSNKYEIKSVPYFIFLNNDKIVNELVGSDSISLKNKTKELNEK